MKLRNLAKMGVVAMSIAAASTAFASKGNQKTEDFNVNVSLIAPLVITETAPMNFPEYVAGDDVGAQVLDRASGAKFNITGKASRVISVSLASGTTTLKKGAGGSAATEITANSFKLGVTGGADIGTDYTGGTDSLTGAGTLGVEVGGTITLEAGDQDGDFTGTNTLRVQYN